MIEAADVILWGRRIGCVVRRDGAVRNWPRFAAEAEVREEFQEKIGKVLAVVSC